MLKPKITEALDRLSSRKTLRYAVYFAAVATFFALILLPPVLGIIIKWNTMQQVLGQPFLAGRISQLRQLTSVTNLFVAWIIHNDLVVHALSAIENSFAIALLVSALDIVAGIPMAWLIARRKSRWLSVLDTISDIPIIVPTAALGYSLLLFWSRPEGISSLFGSSLVSPGWLLVLLLHFAFSYPIVVRVVVGALLDYKREFEQASRTLGAPPFTASRTVTFPIIRPALIAAFILAFSRSLSETGATIMVAGAFENGSVFIQNMKTNEGATVFASFILIGVAIAIFIAIHALGPKLKLPVRRIWTRTERRLSYSRATASRNSITLLVFFALIIIPSLFVALPALEAIFTDTLPKSLTGAAPWGEYWQGLLLSYSLGAVVTILNIILGLPMAILIARKKVGTMLSTILDLLVNVPLIVPSIALGISLKIFWKETFAFTPEILLLVFAHLAITYPYFVRTMSAAVERISMDLEEASRTLGAKPLGVFRTIVLPLTKYSILSGAIMVFTRSVSETGATVAVATSLKTAPMILVDWVKPKVPALPPATFLDIGLGCGFLILFSFIILLTLRFVAKGKGRY